MEAPNGAIANKRILDGIDEVAWVEPTIEQPDEGEPGQQLSTSQLEDLVRRYWQYVAMFDVNNKYALDPDNPQTSGGYNRVFADTDLVDHTSKHLPTQQGV